MKNKTEILIPDTMSASEALQGFVGWLTSCEKHTTMSSQDEMGEPFDAVAKFCSANQLAETREGWAANLVFPACTNPLKPASETDLQCPSATSRGK